MIEALGRDSSENKLKFVVDHALVLTTLQPCYGKTKKGAAIE